MQNNTIHTNKQTHQLNKQTKKQIRHQIHTRVQDALTGKMKYQNVMEKYQFPLSSRIQGNSGDNTHQQKEKKIQFGYFWEIVQFFHEKMIKEEKYLFCIR